MGLAPPTAATAAPRITEKAVGKHINNVFTKLNLYLAEDGNRRVLAVLTYLDS